MNLLTPKALSYYRQLTHDTQIGNIHFSGVENAVILKAHDHGIGQLNREETALLDQVISKLKDEIWP